MQRIRSIIISAKYKMVDLENISEFMHESASEAVNLLPAYKFDTLDLLVEFVTEVLEPISLEYKNECLFGEIMDHKYYARFNSSIIQVDEKYKVDYTTLLGIMFEDKSLEEVQDHYDKVIDEMNIDSSITDQLHFRINQ